MSFFRSTLLACLAVFAVAASAARAAVSISDVHITNVGTTTFTVVWTTSEVSTPALQVFSDAAGNNAITASLGLDYYPIAEGDPAIVNHALARASRRSLEELAANRRVVSVRVTGLAPGTTYYVRPRTFDANGVDNGAAIVPLKSATTAQFTNMVSDARILRIRIPTFAAEGMILLVQGPAGTTPLSAIVGDSAAPDVALFSTAHVVDTATGTNPLFNSPQPFVIKAIGAGAPAATFTQTINFSGSFAAAPQVPIEANIESPAPFFTTQPTNKTVAASATATFTVAANGTPAPTFKWQRKPAGSANWSDLASDSTYTGVTTTTLSVASATIAMSGDQFRAIATNGVPPDAISDAATLTVTAAAIAPVITTQPQSKSVVVATNAAFTVVATGTPEPTYQWQRKPAGSATWSDLAANATYTGTTTASLNIVAPTLAMNDDQFRVIVTNGVLPNATSNAVTLTVSATPVAPSFTTHPASKSAAAGSNTTFVVAAAGTPTPNVAWQIKLAGTDTWLPVGETANYAGGTTVELTVKAITAAMNGDQFRVVASNGTSPDATSNIATLTVAAAPVITNQPAPVSAAAGTTATFTVAATGTGALTYKWQRRAVGSDAWLDLVNNATYTDTATAALKIVGVLPAMQGDQFRVVVTDTVGSTTSNVAPLTVTKGVATIVLNKQRQNYDGTPRTVVATTVPAGLNVKLTYNGSAIAPVEPGVYPIAAQIEDANYSGATTGELVVSTTVLVRRATIAGGIDGSIHVVNPENWKVTGWVSGDLLVPGTPNVVVNGTPTMVGTRDAAGAVTPNNYAVTVESTAALRYLVRRADPVAFPVVPAVPAPTGTRTVTLNAPNQSAGDFATIRNLTISGTAGTVSLPPGTYGNLNVNNATTLVLGVAGATEPAVYNVQNISVNVLLQSARVVIVGPVILNVASTAAFFGNAGNADHPEWLKLNLVAGSASVSGNAAFHGYIVAPNSPVTLNARGSITGGVIADRINVTTNTAVKQPTAP